MRTITVTLLFFFVCSCAVFSQAAGGINYQAVVLDADGNKVNGTDADWNILEDKQLIVRFSILDGSDQGPVLYQETHTAHTDPFGMLSLVIGYGTSTDAGSYGALTDIPWGSGVLFLRVDIDLEMDGTFRMMDNQQMMAVPFAFHARSAGKSSVIEAAAGHDPEEPIFTIINSQGDTVFAVYESGVVIGIGDDSAKGSRGGFAVGGFSAGKGGDYVEYLRVDPGFVRITIDDTADVSDPAKGSRGGFAVGGFSGLGKADEFSDYFHLTPGSALFNLDSDYDPGTDDQKGSRGGFAVGGFSSSKGDLLTEYLRVTGDSIRVYIDDSPEVDDPDGTKGSRGGFAVGGFSSQGKGDAFEYLRIDPGFVRVGISDDDLAYQKGSRAGFAVGGFSSSKGTDPVDYLFITPGSAQFLLDQEMGKGSRGGFAVGGFSGPGKGDVIYDYMSLTHDSTRIYIDGDSGFSVAERYGKEKSSGYDVLFVSPGSTSIYLRENSKSTPEGFAIFNREEDYIDRLFSVTEDGTFVATLFTIAPVVVTYGTDNITSTSVDVTGAVIRDGGAEVTERGFVYGDRSYPTLISGDQKVTVGSGEGPFGFSITSLTPGTTYYVRAYAINSAGTGYGEPVVFETLP